MGGTLDTEQKHMGAAERIIAETDAHWAAWVQRAAETGIALDVDQSFLADLKRVLEASD